MIVTGKAGQGQSTHMRHVRHSSEASIASTARWNPRTNWLMIWRGGRKLDSPWHGLNTKLLQGTLHLLVIACVASFGHDLATLTT